MAKFEKILVTGANGLVGSAIQVLAGVNCGLPEIVAISRKDCDMLRWVEVDAMMRQHRPDAVIHLAAKVGGVKANMSAPATFFMENITMNTHVLEAARIHCVKKVICFLSTCVFPDPCKYPLEPRYLHDGPPHPSNYGYAYAKRMLEVQCRSYNEEYGTSFTPVIPCNIYGPNDNFNLESGHVVPALIRKFFEAKQSDAPVTIWGSGDPLREFIYSRDVAQLLLNLLGHYDSNQPIIISTGQETSIRQLVETVSDAMNFKGQIIFDRTKPDGQHRKPSNNWPLRNLFPNFQFRTLEEGINQTVKWFEQNYPNIRK